MYIQLNSQVICYEKSGEGTPIILLHGNGESHEIFQELVANLQQDYTVYAMDSRGQGESATPKEFHYADMAEDVMALMESLQIQKPTLYGYSDGGIVALMVAMKYPESISKLIVSGANLSPKGLCGSARRDIKNQYKKTGSPLVQMMLSEPDISENDLAKITVPTLVLAGEKDMIKVKETKRIASAISGATLRILPKESHSSYVVHSTALAPILREFMAL